MAAALLQEARIISPEAVAGGTGCTIHFRENSAIEISTAENAKGAEQRDFEKLSFQLVCA